MTASLECCYQCRSADRSKSNPYGCAVSEIAPSSCVRGSTLTFASLPQLVTVGETAEFTLNFREPLASPIVFGLLERRGSDSAKPIKALPGLRDRIVATCRTHVISTPTLVMTVRTAGTHKDTACCWPRFAVSAPSITKRVTVAANKLACRKRACFAKSKRRLIGSRKCLGAPPSVGIPPPRALDRAQIFNKLG